MKIRIEIEFPDTMDESPADIERWLSNYLWDTAPEAVSIHVEADDSDDERDFYEGGGVTPDGKSV